MLEGVLAESAGEAVLDGVLGVVARERIRVVSLVVELDAQHQARTSDIRDLRVLVLQLKEELGELLTAHLIAVRLASWLPYKGASNMCMP